MTTISYVVLDSGILLATAQTETYTQHAEKLLKTLTHDGVAFAAPTLLKYELVAVSRKWVYRNIKTEEDTDIALTKLLNYPVELFVDENLLREAYQLATKYNRPTAYDAQYSH